jgi:lipopolysaccharide export LptBFGC system permease protein LptF
MLNGLWVLDQELMIPRLAPQLAQTHEATALSKPYGVWLMRDRDGAWISASQFDHRAGVLHRLVVMRRTSEGATEFITADRATWEPSLAAGVYTLERGAMYSGKLDQEGAANVLPQPIESFFTELCPDDIALRQSARWLHLLGRGQLNDMRKQDPALAPQIAKVTHGRFATPLVNMLVLIIGVPVFLDRRPGKVVQSGGRCLLICGVCFVFAFLCQNISLQGYPALMAWLPLIALTPLMVLSLDRMKT